MSLILRNVKGSPLTHAEMDGNLEYLEALANNAAFDCNELDNCQTIIDIKDDIDNISLTPGPKGDKGDKGEKGDPGEDGIGIEWLGTFTDAPVSPTLNQAYRNSTDKKSYIWDGSNWEIMTEDGAYIPSPEFNISVNFLSTDDFLYMAPEDFKIVSIDNPNGLTNVITVNNSAYTLGATIDQYDKVKITTDGIGFINLNCEII